MSKILVRSAREGFRRAGIAFTRAGITLDTRKLVDGQLAAIQAEPLLSVTELPDEEKKPSKKPGDKPSDTPAD
jgi:hypothetical protein